jgi:hypothetical protein
MPVKVFNFLPTPLNTANDTSASGFANVRTLQPTYAGGLVLGDAIDLTNFEAAGLSSPTLGLLFEGRYRRVQVAATATAANVGVGKAAFVNPGTTVIGALILTPGSGQTPGVYQVVGTGGNGSGAIIEVIVGTGGTVTAQPTVKASGSGYTSAPTFTLSAGGTAATFQAQMAVDSYIVTDAATAGINLSQGRGVFLNSITPGNFGWIQENGIASFLSVVSGGAAGSLLTPNATGLFSMSAPTTFAPTVFGTSIDASIANTLIRGLMTLPVWNG